MLAVFRNGRVESGLGAAGENDGFLKAHRVHRPDPAAHVGIGAGVVVRVHIDDGVARLFHQCFGDLEDGSRQVIFEEDLVGGCLARGEKGDAARQEHGRGPTEGMAKS